jgi:predicted transcriptional regulator
MLAPSDTRPVNPTSLPAVRADRVRLACGRAIVSVLREAGRPLTVLDLLDDLGRHYRGWTSSTVRHTLAELAERGVVAVRRDQRPCGYALGDGQTTARPG